ncbi:MAG: phage tail sheath protein [Bacillota bacterium]
MGLIIPGVEIRVIRELVPRPLGATGVLGIVGPTEVDRSSKPLQALGSLQEFRETYGPASVMSLPEVRQAFAAGLNQVVVVNIPPDLMTAAAVEESVQVNGSPAKLEFRAKAGGAWGNDLSVRLVTRTGVAAGQEAVEVQVFRKGTDQPVETIRNLSSRRDHARYFVAAVSAESSFVRATLKTAAAPDAQVLPDNTNPDALPKPLTGGQDAMPEAFAAALARLETFPDVDMVAASHRYGEANATQICAEIISHCERMSRIARNRMGFGQTIPTEDGRPNMEVTTRMASRLVSERFVLVAPHGYMGAVIGMIAGQRYFESPTFKSLPGVSSLSFDFTDPQLEALIKAGVCAVDEVPRKGISVVKGITTDTGQINVTRVADRAVRHVQNIAQDFIGLLNTEAHRLALKQRITEAFTRMEREGAIVPSTDGQSPAFAVSVESTPDDFAAGVVRIDTAVRPVRAIDYIYATIKVQAF